LPACTLVACAPQKAVKTVFASSRLKAKATPGWSSEGDLAGEILALVENLCERLE